MRNADTVRGLNRGIGRPLHRYTSLESGVMRKYHAPFGGRPTEKGSNQEYLAGGPPYLISRGGTAHSSAAHLTPTPSRAMGSTFAHGTPCPMADAQRGYSRV